LLQCSLKAGSAPDAVAKPLAAIINAIMAVQAYREMRVSIFVRLLYVIAHYKPLASQ
jgi:hypothetical protein